jgi:hypothetical protein
VRDVRVVERRDGLRFAAEACQPVGIAGEQVGEDLDRDVAVQLRVAGAIHLAHSARAEQGHNFVRAEPLSSASDMPCGL